MARLPELLLAHCTKVGAISEGRSGQVVLWAGAKARHIVALDEASAAKTRSEKCLLEIASHAEIRNPQSENQLFA
jgi:hypothetical protein